MADALLVLDGIGPALRVGLSPRGALEHLVLADPVSAGRLTGELAAAATTPPVARGEDGSPVGHVWYRAAQESDAEDLKLVAAAWTLADICGVALADAVDLAAALLRDARARQSRLDVLLAGPRATMSLLTVLPLGALSPQRCSASTRCGCTPGHPWRRCPRCSGSACWSSGGCGVER